MHQFPFVFLAWLMMSLCLGIGCNSDKKGDQEQGSREISVDSVPASASDSTAVPKGQALNDLPQKDGRLYFYKRFSGALAENLFVSLHLVRDGNQLRGSYMYNHVGQPISLVLDGGIEDSNRVKLRELDTEMPLSEEPRGYFEGPFFNQKKINGLWFSPDKSTNLPFNLETDYGAGSVPLSIKHISWTEGECEANQCLEISFSYPYLDSSHHSYLAPTFNEAIERAMIDALTGQERSGLSLEDAAQAAMREYRDLIADADSTGLWRWQTSLSPRIMTNDSYILSVGLDFYVYSGGAHGNPYTVFLNFDTQKGQPLSLDNYFRAGYPAALTPAVRDRIKLIYGGNSRSDLSQLGFLVQDHEFQLSENYFLSPAGVGFVYNPYELGPYAMGFVEVFYPFRDIPGWLIPAN